MCWQYIKDIFLKCADTHALLTKKMVKGRKPYPWLTKKIKKRMIMIDYYVNQGDQRIIMTGYSTKLLRIESMLLKEQKVNTMKIF